MGLLDFSSKLVGGAQADALDDQTKREAFSQSMLQLAAGINPYGGNLLGDVARGLAGGRQVFGEAANRQAMQGMNYEDLARYWADKDPAKSKQYQDLADRETGKQSEAQRQQRLQSVLGGMETDAQPLSGNEGYAQQAERLSRAGIELMRQGDVQGGQGLIAQAKALNDLRTKADVQALGDRVASIDPYAIGKTYAMGISPDARLSNDTSRRGQDISAQTARRGQDISLQNMASQLAAQTAKDAAKPTQKRQEAAKVVELLTTARDIIPNATGSLIGAARDIGMSTYGGSTLGAQGIAKLKGIEAQLILNMPRLEGPQSNMDQQLYREAAGKIGDPLTPEKTKLAAIDAIEDIQRRYAGLPSRQKPEDKKPSSGIKFLGYE